MAFLTGATAAAALFAPSLLGGPASELLEGWIDGRIAGSVSLRDLELHWERELRARRVELNDPVGEEVARLELRLPGLLTLLGFQRRPWEVEARVLSARVVVDEDGSSNLGRALADPAGGRRGFLRIDDFDSRHGFSQVMPYDLRLRADEVRIDGLAQGLLHLRSISADLSHRPGAEDELLFRAEIDRGGEKGLVDVDFAYASPSPDRGTRGRAPWRGAPRVDLTATFEHVPTAFLDPWTDVPLAGLLGPDLVGELSVVGGEEEGREVGLELGGGAVRLDGVWRGAVLVGRGDELTATLPPSATWVEELVAPQLPAGTRLRRRAASERGWSLAVSGLRVPLGRADEPWPARRELLAGLGGVLELAGPEAFELVDGDGALLERLAAPRVGVALAAGEAPLVEVEGGDEGASLRATIEGRGDLARTLEEGDWRVDLEARGVGVWALEHARGGDGLLPALFEPGGTRLHLERDREVHLELEGPDGAYLRGRLVDDHLVGERAELRIDLQRPRARALVTSLLPWLEELEAEEPALLVLTDYRLPIDGDLTRAEATVRLELGRVRYRLHPGLHGLLAEGEPATVETTLPAARMELAREIVTYLELVVAPAQDVEFDLTGRLDAERGELNLSTHLPLPLVTADVLPGAEETEVPVTLMGPWDAPTKHVDVEVLNELTRGVRGLIEALRGGEG